MNEYFSSFSNGISTDFEALCTKYSLLNSISYVDFVNLWKEMHFDCIFAGRLNDRECREFTEECLKLVSIFSSDVYQFNVRVCSIYLFYALYHTHPFQPKVKIRVTMQEWEDLLNFIEEINVKANELSISQQEKKAVIVDIINDIINNNNNNNNNDVININEIINNNNNNDTTTNNNNNIDFNSTINIDCDSVENRTDNTNDNNNNNIANIANNNNNNINNNNNNSINNNNSSNTNNGNNANNSSDNYIVENELRNHYDDVLYVFNSLRRAKAFQFVHLKTQIHPAMKLTNEMFGDAEQQKIDFLIKRTSAVSRIFNSDAIDEMSAILEEYTRHKQLVCESILDDPSLKVIDNAIIQNITRVVASHEDWKKNKATKKIRKRLDSGSHATSDSEVESEVELASRSSTPVRSSAKGQGDVRSEIKSRAFASTAGTKKFYEQKTTRETPKKLTNGNRSNHSGHHGNGLGGDGVDISSEGKSGDKDEERGGIKKQAKKRKVSTCKKIDLKDKKDDKKIKKSKNRKKIDDGDDIEKITDDGDDGYAMTIPKRPTGKRKRSIDDNYEVGAPKKVNPGKKGCPNLKQDSLIEDNDSDDGNVNNDDGDVIITEEALLLND